MIRVVDTLNTTLHEVMQRRPEVLVIGEDILDPYGGAFKVTKGLSTRFPERVITTPISEAGITGLGIGLSLRGYRPVIEIMFGDFVTLIVDQLLNHASKMMWMYNQPLALPLVVRTPMGGRRGYGATHSQSLERLFMGMPGLYVAAISPVFDPGALLRAAIEELDAPVLFVENKLLYARPLLTEEMLRAQFGLATRYEDGPFPTAVLAHDDAPDITLITYGGMLPLTLEAAAHLHEIEELSCEIIVAHQLAPLDVEPMLRSARRTRRTIVIEEGVADWGWGAEVLARLAEVRHDAPPQRVGARPFPIPASRQLEDQVLPQTGDIIDAALRTIDAVPA